MSEEYLITIMILALGFTTIQMSVMIVLSAVVRDRIRSVSLFRWSARLLACAIIHPVVAWTLYILYSAITVNSSDPLSILIAYSGVVVPILLLVGSFLLAVESFLGKPDQQARPEILPASDRSGNHLTR